jgi:heme/copper-type cytochrome/quinol oxidase subunit 2
MHILTRIPFAILLGLLSALTAHAGDAPAPQPAAVATIGADGVQRLTLVLDSYSYEPANLVVEVNRPVELTLTSESSFVPHNLVLDDPASGLNLRQDVGPGKTVKLTFTPTKVGRFAYYCDKKATFMPSHRAKGMEGTIDVRAAPAPAP